jgi:hypothetical protein
LWNVAGDEEVLTLESYRGVGKFKGKVRVGVRVACLAFSATIPFV